MRAPRTILPLLLLLLSAGLVSAFAGSPLTAATDQIVDGGFQGGGPSIELPRRVPFPLILGGWVVRGEPLPHITPDPLPAADDDRAMRVVGVARDPAWLIQDVALGHPGYLLQLEFLVETGRQSILLLEAWDRRDPRRGTAALRIDVDPTGLTVGTSAGTWRLERMLQDGRWHRLSAEADPRTGLQTIALDGEGALSVPGVPERPPGTLVLGTSGDAPSRVLYDEIGIWRLADLELADLARRGTRIEDRDTADRLLERLATAAVFLRRGAVRLAAPELRMARRTLVRTAAGASAARRPTAAPASPGESAIRETAPDPVELADGLDRLLELLEN